MNVCWCVATADDSLAFLRTGLALTPTAYPPPPSTALHAVQAYYYRPVYLVDPATLELARKPVEVLLLQSRVPIEHITPAYAATMSPAHVASFSVAQLAAMPSAAYAALSSAAKMAILPKAREFLAQSLDRGGADQWKEATDPATGNVYYYRPATGETTWEDPRTPLVLEKPTSGFDVHVSRRGSINISPAARRSRPSEQVSSIEYYYESEIDSAKIEGPFSVDAMRGWYRWGMLSDGLCVRRGPTGPFELIGALEEITVVGRRADQLTEVLEAL